MGNYFIWNEIAYSNDDNEKIICCIDVDADGYLTLMDKQGSTRQDIKLPDDTDEDQKLSERIREALNEGKEIILTVLESIVR